MSRAIGLPHLGWLLLLSAVVVLPLVLPEYALHIAILALYWSYLGLSWNVLGGIGGQLSLGHTVFLAAGAYTSTVLFQRAHLSPWLGMLAGMAVAALLGWLVGAIMYRYDLRGIAFGLATLAFSEMAFAVVSGWDLLGATRGLYIIPTGTSWADFQFRSKVPYYYVIAALVVLALAVTRRVQNTRPGYYLRALQQSEVGVQALGVDVIRMKTAATVLSAAMTAAGGTFYAQYILFIDPYSVLAVNVAVEIVLLVSIGGRGTLWGPVVGPLLLIPLGEFLRAEFGGTMPGLHLLVYGLVLVVVVLLVPGGIVPAIQRLARREGAAS